MCVFGGGGGCGWLGVGVFSPRLRNISMNNKDINKEFELFT